MLLSFIAPCSATRPLREIVLKDLINNFAFPAPSEELLKKIQTCSDVYEVRILENLHELTVALMQELLALLRKDALSFEEIRTKIDTGGYKNPSDQRRRKDFFYFHHLSRWSFDKIQHELTNQANAPNPNFRYLTKTTLKVFLEVESLFQEYVRDCNVTDEIGKILHKNIRCFFL